MNNFIRTRVIRKVALWILGIMISTFALPAEVWSSARPFSIGPDMEALFAPGSQLYPGYFADPMAPKSALNAVRYSDSDISEAGGKRYVFRIGGRLGLLRVYPKGAPERGVQFNLHGTFLGMFDRSHSLDNIGWDGLYGLDVSWRTASEMALKLGFNHVSSHLGDEYAERTGRRRIGYTREELAAGISLPLKEHVRAYAEAGWGVELRNEFQDKWRVQAGLEYKNEAGLWGGRMGYYAAVDITSFEESDWNPDATLQTGVLVPVAYSDRCFRIGMEFRDGRSVLGEFSRDNETYWAWGIWIDL